MKNKRNDTIKRQLEQELPYPKLTVQAELKFDEILALLPEKQASVQKTEAYEGVHFKKKKHVKSTRSDTILENVETEEGMVYFEPVTHRRSIPKTIAKFALSAAAICLVSLLLLNLASPEVAESLPGLGGFFQNINGRLRSTPEQPVISTPVFPKEEQPYAITVEKSVQKGYYLFQTVRLEFSETSCPDTEQLFTSEDENFGITVEVDGTSAVLYRDPVFEKLDGEPVFEGTVISVLPEYSAESSTKSTAAVTIKRLLGVTTDLRHKPLYDDPDIDISKTVTSRPAEVERDTSYEISEGSGLLTVNGFTLVDYTDDEDEFRVSLRFPKMNQAEPYAAVYADHGEMLTCNTVNQKEPQALGDLTEREFIFTSVPTDTQILTVVVYDHDPTLPYMYVNGETIFPLVLAEFTIDRVSGAVYESGSFLDNYQKDFVPLPQFAAVMEAGLRFDHHILAAAWQLCASEARSGNFAEGMPLCLSVVSDLNMDLPLVIEVYIDGVCVEVLPTYSYAAEYFLDENSYHTVGEYGYLDVHLADSTSLGVSTMRQYEYTLNPLDGEADFEVVLRNDVTREILASTSVVDTDQSINSWIDLIGTQEELGLKRTFLNPWSDSADVYDGDGSSSPEYDDERGGYEDGPSEAVSSTPEPFPLENFVDPTPKPLPTPAPEDDSLEESSIDPDMSEVENK